MNPLRLVALALMAVPIILPAQHKKKPTTPAIFANARFVYVETRNGDAYTPGLYSGDRQAIQDVEDALRDWGRYILTTDRSKAELIFVVRKGRIADARIGGNTGPGPTASPYPGQPRGQAPGAPGATIDTEVGPEDDMLDVHMMNTEGKMAGSVWTRTMTDGLDAPIVPLIRNLKNAVEKDYPR